MLTFFGVERAILDVAGELGQDVGKLIALNSSIENLLAIPPRTPVRLNACSIEPGEALLSFGPGTLPGKAGATAIMNLSPRSNVDEAAANLFGYLRELDRAGARAIAVMPIPHHGLGEAINDRLRRAAVPTS